MTLGAVMVASMLATVPIASVAFAVGPAVTASMVLGVLLIPVPGAAAATVAPIVVGTRAPATGAL